MLWLWSVLFFVILFIPFFLSGLLHFLALDSLIKYEYQNYPAQWKEDGSPRGFEWLPPGVAPWKSYDPTREFWRNCEQSPPTWVISDAEALALYRKWKAFRKFHFIAGIVTLVLVVLFLLIGVLFMVIR